MLFKNVSWPRKWTMNHDKHWINSIVCSSIFKQHFPNSTRKLWVQVYAKNDKVFQNLVLHCIPFFTSACRKPWSGGFSYGCEVNRAIGEVHPAAGGREKSGVPTSKRKFWRKFFIWTLGWLKINVKFQVRYCLPSISMGLQSSQSSLLHQQVLPEFTFRSLEVAKSCKVNEFRPLFKCNSMIMMPMWSYLPFPSFSRRLQAASWTQKLESQGGDLQNQWWSYLRVLGRHWGREHCPQPWSH